MNSVPFYANTPDDTHCFQASFRMILKYFLPERDFSWEELEKMSAKQPGLSTWPQQMLLNLHHMDFDIVMIEGFDGPAFAREGAGYLKRTFGEKVAEWQIMNSDIPAEQEIYKRLLSTNVKIEVRQPDLDEFKTFLDDGYLITCTVNSRRLNHRTGYVGHSVVVYAIDAATVTFHDPGSPAHEARQVTRDEFIQAWADPNDNARGLIAVK